MGPPSAAKGPVPNTFMHAASCVVHLTSEISSSKQFVGAPGGLLGKEGFNSKGRLQIHPTVVGVHQEFLSP